MRRLRSDSRALNPHFIPSLQLLVERERYSTTDIGLMFGVSRERARQWIAKYGIQHPDSPWRRGLNCVRVWDDGANRFRPVAKKVERSRRRRAVSEEKRLAREARRSLRRQEMIEAIVLLKARLGRDPSNAEMANAVFGRPVSDTQAGVYLASRWDSRLLPTKKKYREMMAAVCAATGMVVERPRGTLSHLPERAAS